MEDHVKLTETHLVLLSRATQRDDGALDVPATLKDRQEIVGQLITSTLVEEVPARGTLPVWRRDDQAGSLALIITNAGLKAIRADAVVPNGYIWNDKTYRSLSEIARAITGTKWSGPRFFGLRDTGEKLAPKRASRATR
jgi:hypothetical protein